MKLVTPATGAGSCGSLQSAASSLIDLESTYRRETKGGRGQMKANLSGPDVQILDMWALATSLTELKSDVLRRVLIDPI